ncbi:MAG: signal peptidase II [Myxococcales bacterium]|nr:signal peptidase II [Myxococcales bacterium]
MHRPSDAPTRRISPVVSVVSLLSVAGLVGCDHATRPRRPSCLASRVARPVLPGVDLAYTENHDVAFSLLRGVDIPARPVVLAVLPAVATLLLAGARRAAAWSAPRRELVAYVLLLAGALGNLLDRVSRGFVVDFISVRPWPVFNVATLLVVAGRVCSPSRRCGARAARRA